MHLKRDIGIIGAGSTGLPLAPSLAHTSLNLVSKVLLPNSIVSCSLLAELLSRCRLRGANQDIWPFKGIIRDYLGGRASPITSLIDKVGSCF
ncbi:hypothetical protein OQJ13_07710 [Legionella sp. PATHC035]|uniref:hypothetical protein n=1 Tax=Legionella sp. PATHC035 TaxID=2992040 RepID=UPI002243056D|nr:hypothetical protein [Legionella sp. PATHC035]MCW8408856.1 hypothetical protein [Legionella sp. PATHC035]